MSEVKETVIGLLTQDLSVGLKNKFGENSYTCAIGAPYVKFIEDCGGKCLPIAQNQKPEYYEHIVAIVHAVILPGGGFYLADSQGYTPSGILLLDAVNSAAERGRVIPVFGICLGYELMAVYFGSKEKVFADILTEYRPIVSTWKELNISNVLPILLTTQQLEELRKNNIAHFHHRVCVPSKKFNARLREEWQVLATNDIKTTKIYDVLGKDGTALSKEEIVTSITMIESKSRPYFGTQFHPERARHCSIHRKKCPDLAKAEAGAQVFVTILTNMIKAQKCSLTFPKNEFVCLIDRFIPEKMHTDKGIAENEVYMFKKEDLVINVIPNPS